MDDRVDQVSGTGDEHVAVPGGSRLMTSGCLVSRPVVERGLTGGSAPGLRPPALLSQLVRGTQSHQPSPVDERRAVTEAFGFVHVVRDEHDRHARAPRDVSGSAPRLSRRACGSRPVLISSSTAILGCPDEGAGGAIDSRCFWPPERVL